MPQTKAKSTSKRKVQKGATQYVLVGPIEQIKTLFAKVQSAFTVLSGVEEPLKKILAQVSELLEIERAKLTKNRKPRTIGRGLESLALLLDESKKPEVLESREEIEKKVAFLEQILSAGNHFVELIVGVVTVLTGSGDSVEPASTRGRLAEASTEPREEEEEAEEERPYFRHFAELKRFLARFLGYENETEAIRAGGLKPVISLGRRTNYVQAESIIAALNVSLDDLGKILGAEVGATLPQLIEAAGKLKESRGTAPAGNRQQVPSTLIKALTGKDGELTLEKAIEQANLLRQIAEVEGE